jgi:hypothetical protein
LFYRPFRPELNLPARRGLESRRLLTDTMGVNVLTLGTRISQRDLRLVAFVAIASVLSLLYFLIANALDQNGFVSLNLVFFGEKAALALHGLPPRFVNVGFVYPPLSFVLQLPFGSPIAGQAVIAGMLTAYVLDYIAFHVADPVLRWTALAYVLVSPLLLLLEIEDYSSLLFGVLIAAAVANILRFLRDDYSLHLFVGSTMLGLAFFIDFRSLALLVVIVPAVLISHARRSPAQAMSIALTIAVPTLFFALAWSYVNWVFLGDPLAYVYGRGSFFRSFDRTPELLAAAHRPLGTLRVLGGFLLASLPVTLPYFVGFALLRMGRRRASVLSIYAVYAVPIVFVGCAIFGGLYRPTITLVGLFVLTAIFAVDAMRPSRRLTVAFAVSFALSFFAPFVSPNAEERTFANALAGDGMVTGNLTPYRQIASYIGPDGTILIDDTTLFPLVYVMGSPKRFMLPYQYEYASALSNPRLFARYVVVACRGDDSVFALYPGAVFGRLAGYHELFRTGDDVLFERDGGGA